MRLLACTDTVTLVRQIQTTEGDSYACQVIAGVSWHSKAGDSLSRDGEQPSGTVVVRIPEPLVPDPLPQAGDYLVHGVLASCPDRRALDGLEYFRIAAVGDNRRLACLRHVVVKST